MYLLKWWPCGLWMRIWWFRVLIRYIYIFSHQLAYICILPPFFGIFSNMYVFVSWRFCVCVCLNACSNHLYSKDKIKLNDFSRGINSDISRSFDIHSFKMPFAYVELGKSRSQTDHVPDPNWMSQIKSFNLLWNVLDEWKRVHRIFYYQIRRRPKYHTQNRLSPMNE